MMQAPNMFRRSQQKRADRNLTLSLPESLPLMITSMIAARAFKSEIAGLGRFSLEELLES